MPAFTLNVGNSQSPICTALDPMWDAQRPALLYAAKAAGPDMATTLGRASGPVVSSLDVQTGEEIANQFRIAVATLEETEAKVHSAEASIREAEAKRDKARADVEVKRDVRVAVIGEALEVGEDLLRRPRQRRPRLPPKPNEDRAGQDTTGSRPGRKTSR